MPVLPINVLALSSVVAAAMTAGTEVAHQDQTNTPGYRYTAGLAANLAIYGSLPK